MIDDEDELTAPDDGWDETFDDEFDEEEIADMDLEDQFNALMEGK